MALMTCLSAFAKEDTNKYSDGKVNVTTNTDWARVEFVGEPAKAMYELLLENNGHPYQFQFSSVRSSSIKGGGWECTQYTQGKEVSHKCFGDFKGNGFQERDCLDAICLK